MSTNLAEGIALSHKLLQFVLPSELGFQAVASPSASRAAIRLRAVPAIEVKLPPA
jgi:hypothetical protein